MPGTEQLTTSTDVMAATTETQAVPSSQLPDPLDGTPYETVSLLGEGGFGRVYLARDRHLGNLVACKVLQHDVTEAVPRERFRREAAILARLRHPNLVLVHSFDVTRDGNPYMVMEHLSGRTLKDRLIDADGGPLPLDETIDLLCQALEGLHAVHEAGIVHRDVKPGNLFIDQHGTVKVLDLGLAKVLELSCSLTPDSKPLTASNVFMGTARYMAPEQALGTVDRRSDIYSVGAVLYRCVCGRGPHDYARGWDAVVMAVIQDDAIAPSHHLQDPLPEGLDELVLRCLSKQPERRPSTARELLDELHLIQQAMHGSPQFPPGFVTQPMKPSTSMFEAELAMDPPAPVRVPAAAMEAPRADAEGATDTSALTWRTFWLIVAVAAILGGVVGGLAVGVGMR